jgi:hypothetical protein
MRPAITSSPAHPDRRTRVMVHPRWEAATEDVLHSIANARPAPQPSRPSLFLLQLEFSRLPNLLKPWLQWAVKAQAGEPPSARNSLDPITLFANWRLRTKIEVVGAVGVLLKPGVWLAFEGNSWSF